MAAKAARREADVAALPDELWLHIGSLLKPAAIGRLACCAKQLSALQEAALEGSCFYHFPQHAAIARQLSMPWQQRFSSLNEHVTELRALPRPSIKQPVVLPKHRAILVEWLAEVSWAWKLDSSTLFTAVEMLDRYLCIVALQQLGM